jgi:uncharacterized membrane protein
MKVEHQVLVEASIDSVWEVHRHIEQWPALTPSMESAERLDDGPLAISSRARIKQPRLPVAEWTVTTFEPPHRLTWESTKFGVHTSASHHLAERANGGTSLTLEVEMTGIMARLMWPFIRGMSLKSIQQEAAGFKAHCEAP